MDIFRKLTNQSFENLDIFTHVSELSKSKSFH